MYLKIKKEHIRDIISKAAKKAGGMKNLSEKLKITKSTLYYYYNGQRLVSEERFNRILDYTDIKLKEVFILEKFPDNWKQIIGGQNCVRKKIKKGTLEMELKKCRIKSGELLKKWHNTMKKDNLEEYHRIQYERFKKIGGYKHTTKNGEKVRNELEKDIANILKNKQIPYEYEPLIKIRNKVFFPDFVINNKIIIECTAWRGYDKATKLKNKINLLKNKYKFYVVIPKGLYNYYKILDNHLVLGLDAFVPLAQTFPRC